MAMALRLSWRSLRVLRNCPFADRSRCCAPHCARAAYRWCVEVSVYVAASARRRGVGRRLYEVLLEVLRIQGLRNAYAGITLPNPASVALHESLGFEPIGVYPKIGYKLGAWHDVGWWHRRLIDDDAAPGEPCSMEELRAEAAVQELGIWDAPR